MLGNPKSVQQNVCCMKEMKEIKRILFDTLKCEYIWNDQKWSCRAELWSDFRFCGLHSFVFSWSLPENSSFMHMPWFAVNCISLLLKLVTPNIPYFQFSMMKIRKAISTWRVSSANSPAFKNPNIFIIIFLLVNSTYVHTTDTRCIINTDVGSSTNTWLLLYCYKYSESNVVTATSQMNVNNTSLTLECLCIPSDASA